MISVLMGIVNYASCFDDNSAILPPISCCKQTWYGGQHGRCQYGQMSSIDLRYGFCYDETNNPVVDTLTGLIDQSCGNQPHLKVPCGSTAAPISQPVSLPPQSLKNCTPSFFVDVLPYLLLNLTIFTFLI